MNKKITIRYFMITALAIGALFSARILQESRSNNFYEAQAAYVEDTSAKIDFESYTVPGTPNYATAKTYGRLSWTGDIATTSSYVIDNNTLGMRIPKNTTTSRVLRIDVSGYSKVILDFRIGSSGTQVDFGCGRPVYTEIGTTRDHEIPVNSNYSNPVLTITFSTSTSNSSNRDLGIDNIRFFTGS